MSHYSTTLIALFAASLLAAGPAATQPADPPAAPATSPATAPTTTPAVITIGMTLDQANALATLKTQLDGKDDKGNEFYTLTILDDSQPDDDVFQRYSLTVRDGIIRHVDVQVTHHDKPPIKPAPRLWPGNHWYVLTGLAVSGHQVTKLVQARSAESAIKRAESAGLKKCQVHLASEQEQTDLRR